MLHFRLKDRGVMSLMTRRAATELMEASYGDVVRGLGVRRQAPAALVRAAKLTGANRGTE